MSYSAVCFDFWNTVLVSDEAALEDARLPLWQATLADAGHDQRLDEIRHAHRVATAEYKQRWIDNEQYVVADATVTMLDTLGVTVEPSVRTALEDAFSIAGYDASPQMCPGIREALSRVKAAGLATAIVCDIGLTPSAACRGLLDRADLLHLFDLTVFSDEFGSYKPDPAIFGHTLDRLGCAPSASAHVGDRRRTDVEGARRAGLTAIRYAGVFDDHGENDATIVIDHHDQLLDALATVAA